MVMGLDLEGTSPAIANIDDSGIFTRALHHQLAARGQAFEMDARRFVGTVLTPHHAENSQFRQRRLTPQSAFDPFIFVWSNTVFCNDFWSNGGNWRSRHKRIFYFLTSSRGFSHVFA